MSPVAIPTLTPTTRSRSKGGIGADEGAATRATKARQVEVSRGTPPWPSSSPPQAPLVATRRISVGGRGWWLWVGRENKEER
ncbi:hypothetical protein NL676_029701 [Syzygium grande]|nr:hypothetical protein NL676_029701 [Syzygium grande]